MYAIHSIPNLMEHSSYSHRETP